MPTTTTTPRDAFVPSLQGPLSVEALLAAVKPAFELPENVVQPHLRPRASGLADCARAQAYSMTAVVHDAIDVPGSRRGSELELTQEQGRAMEDVLTRLIEHESGLLVVDRQIALPEDYPVSGHPDGRLVHTGPWPDSTIHVLDDGLVWGLDFKHLGRYGYTKTFKQGLEDAHPQYVLQMALYGDALGWDAAQLVIMGQDASAIRGDATANLRAKNPKYRWANQPGWHPKLLLPTLDLRPLKQTLIPVAHGRAKWLTEWREQSADPMDVAREYDPDELTAKVAVVRDNGEVETITTPGFPCSYCPWLQRCRTDGPGGNPAPRLPFDRS